MLTFIYQIILGIIVVLIVLKLWKEEKIWEQFIAAMVLVPLILRLFMIK